MGHARPRAAVTGRFEDVLVVIDRLSVFVM